MVVTMYSRSMATLGILPSIAETCTASVGEVCDSLHSCYPLRLVLLQPNLPYQAPYTASELYTCTIDFDAILIVIRSTADSWW